MNIGILGYGTIGRGVAALINQLPAEYGIKTVKILDLPQKKEELGALYAATKEEICLNPGVTWVLLIDRKVGNSEIVERAEEILA